MKKGLIRTVYLLVAFGTAQFPFITTVDGAPPPGKGGGNNTSSEPSESSGSAPEFYRVFLDHTARRLNIYGIHLIGGDSTTPEYPTEITVGGQSIAIDPLDPATTDSVASTDFVSGEGPVFLPFERVLDALVSPTPGSRKLSGDKNFEIGVTTSGGNVVFSAYFQRDIKDIPVDTGSCPCTFSIYLEEFEEAQTGTIGCSVSEGIPTDQYIEAGYGKIDPSGVPSAVIIGSHSSGSTEPLYESSCYVRDFSTVSGGVETPVYREGPFPVGNDDHASCVDEIQLIANCYP